MILQRQLRRRVVFERKEKRIPLLIQLTLFNTTRIPQPLYQTNLRSKRKKRSSVGNSEKPGFLVLKAEAFIQSPIELNFK